MTGRRLAFERLEHRLLLSVVDVSVDASQVLRQVNDQLLGVNVGYTDPLVDTPQTQQLVEAAGLTMIRFPGGSASDTWHFTDPPTYAGEGTAATMAGLASSAGTGSIVTLDYGSGSPQEAAALLAYLDGSPSNTTPLGDGEQWDTTTNRWVEIDWKTAGYWASLRTATPLEQDDGLNFLRIGRSASFGIQYFEVGNEIYGESGGVFWETDHHGSGGDTGSAHDPATYVAFAKQFAAYAAEITPGISIGVDTGSPTAGDYDNWTTNVLDQCALQGFTPGFLSDHLYVQEPGSESDSTLLLDTVSDTSSSDDWANRAAAYRTLLEQTLGSAGDSVELLATEFNSVSYDPGKQSTSLLNGLFIADSLGSLLETQYDGALVWDLHNYWDTSENNSSSLYGWREGGDYGILGGGDTTDLPSTGTNVPYPSYFAEQLMSKIVHTGDTVVEAASDNQLLSVYAVQQANGDLDLLVINKDPNNDETAQLQFTGFQPSGSTTVWQYGKTQDNAQSQSSDGSSALANFTTSLAGGGSTFSDSFPSYSMTVLDLQPVATTLLIAGKASDDVLIEFTDATDFTVTINGTATVYSTTNIHDVVYNGPIGATSEVIFDDPQTSDAYTATEALSSTTLLRSGGASFEFDANDVTTLYVYAADASSTATITAGQGTGSNFFVGVAAGDYSYIADPVEHIYSELSGFGNEAVSGSHGTTYAYVYSTSHASFLGDAASSTFTAAGLTLTLNDFSQTLLVGASDGTDSVTLDTEGGSFVGTPSFSYVSGTSSGASFLIGALFAANVMAQATNATDQGFFYSYPRDTFHGSEGTSSLTGSATAFASFATFVTQAVGFQSLAVQESGAGTDTADLTSPGNGTFTATPTVSTLVVGGVTLITVDTFLSTAGTFVAVTSTVNILGNTDGGDTANLYDAVGTNALVAAGNKATLTTSVNTVTVTQFGKVNAYKQNGSSDTVNEQAVDFALQTVGNWTTD